MTSLVDKIARLSEALTAAAIPHTFGGALALAWCTGQPRGTADIDLNLFVPPDDLDRVIAALPSEVTVTAADRSVIRRDGQARLWWDRTPVDVFFNTTDYHRDVGSRVRTEHFAGRDVAFLACVDLVVFKAFFDRTKDWADIEEMVTAASFDSRGVLDALVEHLGPLDHRVVRLRSMTG